MCTAYAPPDSSRRGTLLFEYDIEQRTVNFRPTAIVNEGRNRFIIMKLIRARAVSSISAKVSWPSFGPTFSDLPIFPRRASSERVRANHSQQN
jgi:hypothetical protein